MLFRTNAIPRKSRPRFMKMVRSPVIVNPTGAIRSAPVTGLSAGGVTPLTGTPNVGTPVGVAVGSSPPVPGSVGVMPGVFRTTGSVGVGVSSFTPLVDVRVGVRVGPVGVLVVVAVAVAVRVGVDVSVGVAVGVSVGVDVSVGVEVSVGVDVIVVVGVIVSVTVAVTVAVGVKVNVITGVEVGVGELPGSPIHRST
jgi:hypothetical protein